MVIRMNSLTEHQIAKELLQVNFGTIIFDKST